MSKTIFKGSGVALVTPFNDGKVDYDALKRIIEFQIENNTDAIIVCGTTGEASTMSVSEKIQVVEFTKKCVNGRTPIIVGTGSNSTYNAIEFSKEVEKIGVDGLLVVTPYYNKATQEGIVAHYREIASNVDLPIIMYNVPSRTGLNMLPDTVARLSKEKNIVAIKEASGMLSQVAEIASLCDIDIYSGNDDQILPCMSLGAKGVISVLANVVPKQVHDMVELFDNGNIDKSRKIQLEYMQLIKLLFCEVNPIPIKAALEIMGMIKQELRLPLTKLSDEHYKMLVDELIKKNILERKD